MSMTPCAPFWPCAGRATSNIGSLEMHAACSPMDSSLTSSPSKHSLRSNPCLRQEELLPEALSWSSSPPSALAVASSGASPSIKNRRAADAGLLMNSRDLCSLSEFKQHPPLGWSGPILRSLAGSETSAETIDRTVTINTTIPRSLKIVSWQKRRNTEQPEVVMALPRFAPPIAFSACFTRRKRTSVSESRMSGSESAVAVGVSEESKASRDPYFCATCRE
mmetsp:Transcript_79073/g.235626  ORF Transcript_79073/g.235626 Transcript_79073/m.235626 type:complete len:221 (+) Transcript_79073:102-764(+)